MSDAERYSARVVIGVIGHDIHIVANRILAIALTENGYATRNLGTNNTIGDFVDAVVEWKAQAALVGSLNGEGPHWCRGAREAFEARRVGDTLLYVGGMLTLGDASAAEVERTFKSFGFDRVFHRPISFVPVLDALAIDLRDKRSRERIRSISE